MLDSRVLLMLLAASLAVLVAGTRAVAADWHEELLARMGVGTTREALIEFVRSQRRDDEDQERVASAIARLADEDFFVRVAADRELARIGIGARAALERAAESRDAEVAWRAERLLKRLAADDTRAQRESLLLAALQRLGDRPAPELVPILLREIGRTSDTDLGGVQRELLWRSVRPRHAGAVRTLLDDRETPVSVRTAAIVACEAAAGADAVSVLRAGLSDSDPRIRLATARALVDHLPEESAEALQSVRDATDRTVARRAAHLAAAVESARKEGVRVGARRWEVDPHEVVFDERFIAPAPVDLEGRFGLARYTTNANGRAAVRNGRLLLFGKHRQEGEQRLAVRLDDVLGEPGDGGEPRELVVSAEVAGDGRSPVAWHVGVSCGELRVLFHPAYSRGAFRAEQTNGERKLFGNVDMGFTPAADEFHRMTIRVERVRRDVFAFHVEIASLADPERRFTREFEAPREFTRRLDRIGLERSGRQGGTASFRSLRIRVPRRR